VASIHERGPARIEANLTPMIDVTFLLIIFFVLVSQIVEVENVDLALPELIEPATDLPGDSARAVINVVPGPAGRAAEYRLGSRSFPVGDAGAKALADHLTTLLEASPGLHVNLRADRATHYEWVEPVLGAIASAGRRGSDRPTARVNLVVVREE